MRVLTFLVEETEALTAASFKDRYDIKNLNNTEISNSQKWLTVYLDEELKV